MGHGPAVKLGKDNASAYKTRLGVYMFIVYTLTYVLYVGINAVKPTWMGITFGPLNVATMYGLGLIIFAFVLAAIYNHFCTAAEKRFNS